MAKSRSLFSLSMDAWLLGLEASSVIGLRMAKIAAGDSAAMTEAQLMIREKLESAALLQSRAVAAALGGPPQSAATMIAHYRGMVRANQRRLSKR